MFIELLKKEYGVNNPIFASDIIKLFSNYTRAYVFRLINKAIKNNELSYYCKGVYYIPKKTFFGASTICSEIIAEKKYVKNGKSIYGIYAGQTNLNMFGLSTQVPNFIEIISNNESTRKRKVIIDGKEYILRKSRCKITNDNYPEYTLFQLFDDISKDEKINDIAKTKIYNYIKSNNVTKEKLFAMSINFPSIASKNMIKSGVLNGII